MSVQYIVSGSNGYLGAKVVSLLLSKGEKVIGLCRNLPDINSEKINYVPNDVFLEKAEKYMNRKTIFIHLAFARANRGAKEIAESLDFTKSILDKISNFDNLEKFIYISSQSVYGKTKKIRSVNNQVEPVTPYAMAKYAAEKLVESNLKNYKYCILRLDNVIQSQNLINVLVKCSIMDHRINITGGKQIFSYIDGDDAASAIVVCACSKKNNKLIYNVGFNKMRISLIEIANIIEKIAMQHNNKIEIIFKADDTELWAGMDTEDFCKEFNWKPQYNIIQMITRIYETTLNMYKNK